MANSSLLLRFKMLGDVAGLKTATGKAGKDLGVLGKTTDRISKGMKSALAGIGLGLSFGGIVSYLKQATERAELARQADARVQQVAKSMKLFGDNLPGVTKRLADYADQLELTTGVEAETTKQVEATLLTFSAVGKTADKVGGIFDRATQAALDLAAAGFGTAEGNAVQLGKALNDPIKGIASLAKSGVTFTAAEKKRIKVLVESGKLGKAQALVLGAIETQVGGVAEKTALSSVKIKNAFGQISDKVGEAVLPYLDKFSKWVTSKEGQAELKKLAEDVKGLVTEAGNLAKWALENKDTIIAIGTGLAAWKISKGALDSWKTLKETWDLLAKLRNKISPPAMDSTGLTTGGTVPTGGKTPTPVAAKPGGKFSSLIPSVATVTAGAAAAIVAMKAESYKGEKGRQNAIADIARAQAEYGKYYSATELLLATGKKTVANISAGGSNMSTVSAPSKDTYNIKIEGSKLTGEQIVALLRKYSSKRGKSAGRFIDLG